LKDTIINVSFRERYIPFQERLKESIAEFGSGVNARYWTNEIPKSSPPHANPTHYAFKLFAFQEALRFGYDRVLWLDSGTELQAPIEPILQQISARAVLLVADRDPLSLHCGDECLRYFGRSRSWAETQKLTGGGIIGIDFTTDVGKTFYTNWWKAYWAGLYKDMDHDHRWDESIFGCLVPNLELQLVHPGPLWQWDPAVKQPCILRTGYER
jgi:hypothetical protein